MHIYICIYILKRCRLQLAREMEEDDGVGYVRRTKAIHYGSLEEQERLRSSTGTSAKSTDVQAGIAAGNINISDGLCFISDQL